LQFLRGGNVFSNKTQKVAVGEIHKKRKKRKKDIRWLLAKSIKKRKTPRSLGGKDA